MSGGHQHFHLDWSAAQRRPAPDRSQHQAFLQFNATHSTGTSSQQAIYQHLVHFPSLVPVLDT